MLVTAYGVDKTSGAMSILGIPLGKLEHVENAEVQELIIMKMKAYIQSV